MKQSSRKHNSPLAPRHPSPKDVMRKSIDLKSAGTKSSAVLRNARKSPSNFEVGGMFTPSSSAGANETSRPYFRGSSHRKEQKNTSSAGGFDDLLAHSTRYDEKCDAEIQSITEVILHNPAGQKSLQGLVEQQQREQQGDRIDVSIPTDSLMLSETGSETSAETSCASQVSVGPSGISHHSAPTTASVDFIDLRVDVRSLSLEKLAQIQEQMAQCLNIVASELVSRKSVSSNSNSSNTHSLQPPASTRNPKLTSGGSNISSGSSTKGRQVSAPISISATAHRFKNGHVTPAVSRGFVRRNSKDKNLMIDQVRRSLPNHDDDLPFPLHDDETAIAHAILGYASHDDVSQLSLRPGAIPPNAKMFESGRDFFLGTSPNTKSLPNFDDSGKPSRAQTCPRPLQVRSVKPKKDDEIKKYYGDGNDNAPMFETLTETLSFLNSQRNPTAALNVSPRTAFDDRSLGSQSTASTSSGRAQTNRGCVDYDNRTPSSALSRSLRARSVSSCDKSTVSAVVATDQATVPGVVINFISIAVGGTVESAQSADVNSGERPGSGHSDEDL